MTEEKIRIKPHPLASLASRIVIVSLCFWVLPLFFHSLLLYKQEYSGAIMDAKEILALTARGQKVIFEERIQSQWKLLDRGENQEGVVEIDSPADLPEYFLVLNANQGTFYIGKKISATRAIAISSPVEALFQELKQMEITEYPIDLCIEYQGKIIIGAYPIGPLFVRTAIENSNISLLFSIPIEIVEKLHKTWYFSHFLSLLFFVGALGGFLVWLITRRVARPLRQLFIVMKRVGGGAKHIRYAPDKMGFEINEIGKQFNETLDLLLERTAEAERERIVRERLAEEWKIGREIQASLFPSHIPELTGLDIASGFLPAKEVSGDFYDLFSLGEGKLMIAIADTAGKGISACLFSLGLRSMLRVLATEKRALSEIVILANELLWEDTRRSAMFTTLWMGIYDSKAMSLEFCSQGHPPGFLLQGKNIEELWTPGIALGAQSLDVVSTKIKPLQIGDVLFLYTDGMIEARNEKEEIFGIQRLKNCVVHSYLQSSRLIVRDVLAEIESFSSKMFQHDDKTVLVLRLK